MVMVMGDWISETNWTVASGSLFNSVSFQSSLSSSHDSDSNSDSNSNLNSPLILHPPSPDSPPCQITIKFKEKHEVRQVYVRSTARLYEIYFATNLHSDNDYLCTVRCGVATRDHQLLLIHSPTTTQDPFEATAEIDDANPCVSVTIRLLSLQTKDCVYVDEIYVFGDPVDSESLETHNNENSSASTLMAMFLPTIMQLSKSSGLSCLNAVSKDGLGETHPSDSIIKTQLKGKLTEVNGCLVGPSHPDSPSQFAKIDSNYNAVPSQTAETENNHTGVHIQVSETECNHSANTSQVATTGSNHGNSSGVSVESALERLITRMDRIEEICLGFQEKMVMPMSNIEARLQRVEQQLDTLSKKLQNSGSHSCCTISAPDASCLESDANSPDNCFGYTATTIIESDVKDLHIHVLDASPDDTSYSANATQLLPGLVVKAPEFPDGDDEEDDASGQEMNSSNDNGKLSIDDALSSALANLLSSTSPRYNTKRLTVKAPEFSNEDDDDDHEIERSDEIEKNDLVHVAISEKIDHIQLLTPSDISLQSSEMVDRDSNCKHSEEIAQEAEEYAELYSGEADQADESVNASIVAEHNPRTVFNNLEDENGKINGRRSDGLSFNGSNISNELLDNQTTNDSSITQERLFARTDLTIATEVPKKASNEDIIENLLGFSLASSVVNFETPLLDVKFISQTSPVTNKLSLEALLIDTPEGSDVLPNKEQFKSNGDVSDEGQSNLVSIDDGEHVNQVSDSHFAVDANYCTSESAPVNNRDDSSPEDHKRKRDHIYRDFSSSLI
ncbi:PREDICTED: uncharacterized protein LOC109355603 isoform X2 [Lupinus angustifolius]|uniref:uncharacterized protein LOC109355603 isoform X2 n=1 Tax=Lupinus angustifolius TaxID=3871 RepID=UPI00092E4FD2|nr:PREDICTED: uncharacterized protein LOC109355603 isoform X2 [Lupinus angustifolius]